MEYYLATIKRGGSMFLKLVLAENMSDAEGIAIDWIKHRDNGESLRSVSCVLTRDNILTGEHRIPKKEEPAPELPKSFFQRILS